MLKISSVGHVFSQGLITHWAIVLDVFELIRAAWDQCAGKESEFYVEIFRLKKIFFMYVHEAEESRKEDSHRSHRTFSLRPDGVLALWTLHRLARAAELDL